MFESYNPYSRFVSGQQVFEIFSALTDQKCRGDPSFCCRIRDAYISFIGQRSHLLAIVGALRLVNHR
jgi:hypothetical protein